MFRKTNDVEAPPPPPKKLTPSVISSHINILGNIISEGLIDFDGSIDGNIQCHSLLVRPNARINGEIKADSVQVSGRVFGTIRARIVTLQASAHVEGIVMHEQIIVEDGATVDGKLKKISRAEVAFGVSSPSLVSDSSNKAESEEDALIMEHIRLISANN